MRKSIACAAIAALAAVTLPASAASAQTMQLRPDQQSFFGLYKELVETDTTVTHGSCTLAAQRMAARLKAAGYSDADITLFSVPEHPKDGGLVAILPGTSKAEKPMLLLAHIDVVEAKREDWVRDPFTLIEEDGFYYARGTVDDKAMASIWTDAMIRMKQQGYKPKRTIKLALTCGEETSGAFNGAEWLANNRRGLIDAAFALNEGGGGRTDGKGHLLVQTLQVGEKAYQDFTLTTTNPGGHSSQPVRKNAIYELSEALLKVRDHEFPIEFNEVTKAFFLKAGAMRKDATGAAMLALANDPSDKAALAVVDKDKMLHSMLRTTCVATLVDAGHALNALPQRAEANVNCRMFPGRTGEETMAALEQAIGDPGVKIEMRVKDKPIAKAPPLDPQIVRPVEKLAAKYFPGVPVLPTMSTGATDGVYLEAVGIPVYGVPSVWVEPDGNGIHGLNERIEARALYTARDYLFDLVKVLAK
ncbi:M20/M25/M40 family metallo-hydrolase [Novosphingobium sp. ZN18A2]|uniref:M20/M25/M40 family metallo-hydrolase n=1 Tax=Novosphingobium sp. ZN18A2 TaxID=3079861 RepID=UPI0030D2D199